MRPRILVVLLALAGLMWTTNSAYAAIDGWAAKRPHVGSTRYPALWRDCQRKSNCGPPRNIRQVKVKGDCRSQACQARVERKLRRAVVRPYRAWLSRVRLCESGGNYAINTGNGFYGAYQFTLSSWWGVGGDGWPHHAEVLEQDYRAVRLLHVQGRGAWPVCG